MDGFIWVIIIFSIVSAISFAFRQQNITQLGKDLAYQFNRIGTIVGKSKQEIIAFVGQPSSFSTMPEGKTLLQWQATGYHIATPMANRTCIVGIFANILFYIN